MTDHTNANGGGAQPERQRPSWYVPIQQTPDDGRTVQDALRRLEIVESDDDLGAAAADIEAYLERISRKGVK